MTRVDLTGSTKENTAHHRQQRAQGQKAQAQQYSHGSRSLHSILRLVDACFCRFVFVAAGEEPARAGATCQR